MINLINYKNYELELDTQIITDMHKCLQKDNAINMIGYLLKISSKDGYTVTRFTRIARLIRNLFFAMNPDHQYYEKVRLFFEYSNCIIISINIDDTFQDIEIVIYQILKKLRNVFLEEKTN